MYTNLGTVIESTKANAFKFAESRKMTKQQAMAFAILAINAKGVCISTAVEQVCGKDTLGLINEIDYTASQLTEAVRATFFAL